MSYIFADTLKERKKKVSYFLTYFGFAIVAIILHCVKMYPIATVFVIFKYDT